MQHGLDIGGEASLRFSRRGASVRSLRLAGVGGALLPTTWA